MQVSSQFSVAELRLRTGRLLDYLVKAVERDELESDLAEELAQIFGVSLCREVVAEVHAVFKVRTMLPIGMDADDLDGDEFEVSLESASYSCVEIDDVDVDSVEVVDVRPA